METLFNANEGLTVPKVTVIVRVYNDPRGALETLESLREQTIKVIDLIVVDDRSSDESADVVKVWLRQNSSRFRKSSLFRQDKNSGPSAARNQGFENAETEFVLPLEAGDFIYPSCLEKFVKALASCRCFFAYCILECGFETTERSGFPLTNLRQWDPSVLGIRNYINSLALFRKDAWRMAGKYDETLGMGYEVYDLWLKIARCNGSGLHLPQILARIHARPASISNNAKHAPDGSEYPDEYLLEAYPEFFAK